MIKQTLFISLSLFSFICHSQQIKSSDYYGPTGITYESLIGKNILHKGKRVKVLLNRIDQTIYFEDINYAQSDACVCESDASIYQSTLSLIIKNPLSKKITYIEQIHDEMNHSPCMDTSYSGQFKNISLCRDGLKKYHETFKEVDQTLNKFKSNHYCKKAGFDTSIDGISSPTSLKLTESEGLFDIYDKNNDEKIREKFLNKCKSLSKKITETQFSSIIHSELEFIGRGNLTTESEIRNTILSRESVRICKEIISSGEGKVFVKVPDPREGHPSHISESDAPSDARYTTRNLTLDECVKEKRLSFSKMFTTQINQKLKKLVDTHNHFAPFCQSSTNSSSIICDNQIYCGKIKKFFPLLGSYCPKVHDDLMGVIFSNAYYTAYPGVQNSMAETYFSAGIKGTHAENFNNMIRGYVKGLTPFTGFSGYMQIQSALYESLWGQGNRHKFTPAPPLDSLVNSSNEMVFQCLINMKNAKKYKEIVTIETKEELAIQQGLNCATEESISKIESGMDNLEKSGKDSEVITKYLDFIGGVASFASKALGPAGEVTNLAINSIALRGNLLNYNFQADLNRLKSSTYSMKTSLSVGECFSGLMQENVFFDISKKEPISKDDCIQSMKFMMLAQTYKLKVDSFESKKNVALGAYGTYIITELLHMSMQVGEFVLFGHTIPEGIEHLFHIEKGLSFNAQVASNLKHFFVGLDPSSPSGMIGNMNLATEIKKLSLYIDALGMKSAGHKKDSYQSKDEAKLLLTELRNYIISKEKRLWSDNKLNEKILEKVIEEFLVKKIESKKI